MSESTEIANAIYWLAAMARGVFFVLCFIAGVLMFSGGRK